jgi:hypothetical protein
MPRIKTEWQAVKRMAHIFIRNDLQGERVMDDLRNRNVRREESAADNTRSRIYAQKATV